MGRPLRFIPPGGSLVEIGLRCQEAKFLLTPSPESVDLTIGVLGRAQRRSDMKVVGLNDLSNHSHKLLIPEDSEQLADFLHYANGNQARELSRLHGKRDGFWAGRSRVMLVSDEEEAQVGRLRYLLSQGCKENLVASPLDWPGLHTASLILSEEPIKGTWVDRTGSSAARQRWGDQARIEEFEEEEFLELSQLPCWEHLSWEEYQGRIREMVIEIEEETKARHQAAGTRPLGRRSVLKMNPHHKPKEAKRSRAPLIHAASKKAREAMRAAYREFVAQFLAAREELRRDPPAYVFPAGSFPSQLPFVPPVPILEPG